MTGALSADVLLLAVGDKARYRTRGGPGTVVAGAVVCEQVLAGTPVTRFAPDRFGLVDVIRERAPQAVDEVAAPLSTAGILSPYVHKVMGLFPRHGYRVLDDSARIRAEQRLHAGLAPGARPDRHEAALALLCAMSGIARAVAGSPSGRGEAGLLAAHLNSLAPVVGPDACEVLLAVRQAYGRRGSGDGAFVPDGDGRGGRGSDGYGDSGGSGDGGGGDGGGDGGGGD